MQPVDHLWNQCRQWPVRVVAKQEGLTPAQLLEKFQTAGLMGNGPKDPSPGEIKRATLELQSQWTPEIWQVRWVGKRGRSVR